MSKRKPILLILTKFPNHIVFQSQLDNSNHTKPIKKKLKKKTFLTQKKDLWSKWTKRQYHCRVCVRPWSYSVAPLGVPTGERGLGISLLSILTDPSLRKLFEDHHLNPMETLLVKNPKPQLSVWLESFKPSKRSVGRVRSIGLQVKTNQVKNDQFKWVENRFEPIGLLEN